MRLDFLTQKEKVQFSLEVKDGGITKTLRNVIYWTLGWLTVNSTVERMLITALVSTLEEDNKLKRISSTHREGRGADIRSSEFMDTGLDPQKLVDVINEAWYSVGAISKESGKQIVAVFHNNGEGWHIHLQVKYGSI